ncbi:MAG: carbohydrate-binding family 9-like protein [Clostridia bacterium]|nr:carbohydrate-binding family 9-like protein [Clostridia bacterium]
MNTYLIKKTTALFAEDVNWKQTDKIYLTSNKGDGNTKVQTKCYLAYNEKGIFFRFEVEDDKINCTMKGYNEPIYDEETVELFIQPTPDKSHYMEFEWNGIGGVFCAEIENDLKGKTKLTFVPENIIDSKVYVEEYGWVVQGMLPAELFGSELTDEWKFNAYRIKLAGDSQVLYSYNNTIEHNFHIPDKFAVLKFE